MALKNEIHGLILQINLEIDKLRNAPHLSPDEKEVNEEKIVNLEKSKEGLREAKFYVGLAEN